MSISKKGKARKSWAIALLSITASALLGSGFIVAGAEQTEDIIAPDIGFKKVVHYEFKDETNLGKDSLGNYDLIAKNVSVDPINGGIALKNDGLLYAPALGEVNDNNYTDFSDLVKGSFSVSYRVYLRNNHGGGNYLFTSGSYGSHFTMHWAYGGIGANFGNGQSQDFMNDGTKDMLSSDFAWYRVTGIYDESALKFTFAATKESDMSYSFTGERNLESAITFGGHSQYSFTIGAQSHLGEWADGHANAELSDGTVIYPNISDFRLYSGVIDDNEIAAIAKYDADNLAAATAVTYDANPIAFYSFADMTNAGKDSMGNLDLALKSDSPEDYSIADGAITLKNNNVLYAGDLGNGADIADKLDAFTLALDVKMANPGSGEFDIVSTGKYSEALRVTRNGNGLNFYPGGNGNNQWVDNVFLDNEWQTIIVTGNITQKYMAIYVNKQGETATMVASISGADGISLANHCVLTFGGDSYFGREDSQHSNPTLKNIRIYDFMLSSAQATQLLTEGKVKTEATQVKEIKKVTTTVEVDADASEAEILAVSELPESVEVINEAGNTLTANIIWTTVEKGDFSAKLTGFVTGLGVNNYANIKVELIVEYAVSEEEKKDILPLVWYEFSDETDLGKDSMGNFDLLIGGNGLIAHDAEGGYITFTRDNASYLYAPALFGNFDWSDMLKGGYTFSYTVKADNSIQAGDRYAVTSGPYGEGFTIYGCYNGYEVVYSAGGSNSHKARFETGSYKDTWITITVTADTATSTLCFYINGELFGERTIDDFRGFSDENLYSFVIGAQATVNGVDGAQFFEGSLSDVKVYDFPLSAKNVKDLYNNANTATPFSSVATYYTVSDITVDATEVDLVLDGNNTVEDILAALPATVTVTDSRNRTEISPVRWLGRNGGVIEGYVQGCSAANISGKFATVRIFYVVDFAAPENGRFVEVKVNGTDYAGTALTAGENATVSFRLSADKGYRVSSVVCNTLKLTADENGVYTVLIDDYSKLVAYLSAEEYTITYVLNNGEADETQIYGYGENVVLADYFIKSDFVFDGWYLNADLSGEKVIVIDSLNPSDITLYAKWRPVGTGDSDSSETSASSVEQSGCGSSLSFLSVTALALGTTFAVKKRRKKS